MSKEISLANNWETSSNLKLEHDPRIAALDQIRDDVTEEEEYQKYPNTWTKIRHHIAEPAAEFMGVLFLILFGTSVICQVVLGGDPNVSASARGDFLSINFGWGVGAAIGVWACAGISGAHINPAITLALAVWRDFPWKKVPIYIIAQVLGATMGALLVYGNYARAIAIYEGGAGIRTFKTAGFFASYPLPYVTNFGAFFDEFLGTTVFVMGILAITDKANAAPSIALLPIAVFFLFLGMGTGFGMQTGYALNPARDLGPRLMTAMVGYGTQVFTFRGHYWFWCNIIGTCLGAQMGTFIYDALIYTGEDSILNKPGKTSLRASINVRTTARGKSPAPIPLETMV
jgi:aquaglyceroporin related protein, other eukaryote